MIIDINECGCSLVKIETDNMPLAIKMIHGVIADELADDEEFGSIYDICRIKWADRTRAFFRWGGENGDNYLVTFG